MNERHARYEQARVARRNAEHVSATQVLLQRAEEDLDEYALRNEGVMPTQYEGMLLTVQHEDAWRNSLRYDIENGNCVVRSAGPDQQFDTRDDVTRVVGIASAEATFASAATE
jgi:hypothetical protein